MKISYLSASNVFGTPAMLLSPLVLPPLSGVLLLDDKLCPMMTHLSSFYFPLLNKLSPFNANCHWRNARPLSSPSKSEASHSLVSEYRSAYLRLLHLLCFPDGRRPLTPKHLPGMLHPVDNPLLIFTIFEVSSREIHVIGRITTRQKKRNICIVEIVQGGGN